MDIPVKYTGKQVGMASVSSDGETLIMTIVLDDHTRELFRAIFAGDVGSMSIRANAKNETDFHYQVKSPNVGVQYGNGNNQHNHFS